MSSSSNGISSPCKSKVEGEFWIQDPFSACGSGTYQYKKIISCFLNCFDVSDLQVMPYSTGCKTPISNFEAGQEYRVCNLKLLFFHSYVGVGSLSYYYLVLLSSFAWYDVDFLYILFCDWWPCPTSQIGDVGSGHCCG